MRTTPFILVPLDDDNLSAVAQLHVQEFAALGHTPARALEELCRGECQTAVALSEKGAVIGYAQARADGATCWLSWMSVAKKHRRTGAGAALLKSLRAWAKTLKSTTIETETRNRFQAALHFYLASGFEIVGTRQGADGDTMIRLRLAIAGPGVRKYKSVGERS